MYGNDDDVKNQKSVRKRAKNKCISINKKAKKDYFKDATKNGIMTNQELLIKLKRFLTNKGFFLRIKWA